MSDAAPGTSPGAAKPPLDDVMLAMDVVDTLRRKERLVQHELDSGEREQALKARLRKIYAAQGLEVSDAILDEAVRALEEDRFVYKPPEPTLGVALARIYVARGGWGKWLLGGLVALVLLVVAWQMLVVAPRAALPERLQAMHSEVEELAVEPNAVTRADRLFAAGGRALRDGDTAAAEQALKSLDTLRGQLEADYDIRIINRPSERSGVWRIPPNNPDARNYYLIVEAVGPRGHVLKVPITNEETGKTERVDAWGLRVDKATFDAVAADKRDDGIIQADLVGHKAVGRLMPDYRLRTTGAAITDW
ncbi:MAG: DUF6384 family protein [Thiohalocapsa sp.]|uniref:DUF6384 family protein n=1 Tax=Thiohalocapsa sp. TaxID=2497641 RepID=UPI0025EEEE71|nr:DUF6384 family protein [Thiohalocapsa sp.]MCG6943285.1 DUF6384 family protein [Thiohalocapsa sp.]